MNPHLMTLVGGEALSDVETEALFGEILTGALDDAQIGAALAMLQLRGPTVEEVVGAARSMRAHVTPIPIGPGGRVVVDTCGTGGAPKTFNVSTLSAIVAASASDRLAFAKHGNRSRTGRGSAEVLQALGVNIDASPERQAACLDACGVCFCFAVHHHPAMKHAIGARRSLGFPTLFNLLGPLTNPARASRQVIGVYAPHLVEMLANAQVGLGAERAIIAHSEDGLDELSTTAPNKVAHVRDGSVSFQTLDATTLGLARATVEDLR
ncbi:MAG: anthranilate phosphoribosyltransferase, partial [Phycisphaerales bacterium]|nr:anthranilate phosphoribosyltransferase [Phycisphaerales bacterium]